LFTVVIPFDYAGADAISAVTGGTASIEIIDQRGYQRQTYTWSGAQFTPAAFQQATGFISRGVPTTVPAGSAALYYTPTGTSGAGTAHLVISGNPGEGMPSLNIDGIPADGTAATTYARFEISTPGFTPAGIPQLELPTQVGIFNEDFDSFNLWTGGGYITGSKGMTVWAKAAQNAIDFQGQTIGGAYDQAIRLNYLGGNVLLGPVVTVDALGDITGVNHLGAVTLTANDAEFETCEVANSPVRTFANTPEGEGPSYPPAGIGISTGTSWVEDSIDPASLATWPGVGIPVSTGAAWGPSLAAASLATWPAAGIPVSTGSACGASLAAASLATWPPAGVAVSTGTAWGAAIPTADVARLSVANNFTAAQTFATVSAGTVTARNGLSSIGTPPLSSAQSAVTIGLGTDGASPAINWVDTGAPADARIWRAVVFANSTLNFTCLNDLQTVTNTWMTVTRAGAVPSLITLGAPTTVTGTGTVQGGLIVAGAPGVSVANTIRLGVQSSGASYLDFFGPNSTTQGTFQMRASTSGGETVAGVLLCYYNLFSILVSTNVTGNFYASGTITSGGAKGFRIQHPLDETKDLMHVAVEGPECAVFYRGEGVAAGGWAEITLPDYFEALTMQENRTVQLTAIFEEDDEPIGPLAASRVKDGRFRVWAGVPTQKFYWEVKAVRADIEPLEVKIERGTQHQKGDQAR